MRKQATDSETWRQPPHASNTHSTEAVFVSWKRARYAATVLKLVTAPPTNERGPRYMEKALAAIHQANHQRASVVFEYGSSQQRVGLFVEVSDDLEQLVCGPITANYPQCSVTTVEPESSLDSVNHETLSAELTLAPELFPILRHGQFEDQLNRNFADPINGILRAIKPDESTRCRVEIAARPASHRRRHAAIKALHRLDRPFFHHHHRLAGFYARHITRRMTWPLAWIVGLLAIRSDTHFGTNTLVTSTSRTHEREADLQAASDKLGGHLFEVRIRLSVTASASEHRRAQDRLHAMTGSLGAFTRSRLAVFRLGPLHRGGLQPMRGRGFLLSHEELATLWHPPTATVLAEQMQTTEFPELEAPAKFYSGREEEAVIVGRIQFRDDRRVIGIGQEDRRRHLYIVGKTGMGKTTLLLNQLHADLQAGHGVCLVDPHGDLATSILRLMPTHRTNDVIVFDAGDREFAVSFNPLACRDDSLIDQVTSGVVSAFKKLHDSWGPRLEDTLRNAVFAIVEQGGTMLELMRLLAERNFRDFIVPKIRDDVVRSFWMHEFASWDDRYRTEAVAAIQNKIRPFLTNRTMRAIVSQPDRSLNLREIMDQGKVLIVNLSKGRVGEDNATLLGAFLVTAIQQAAMTRADVPEADRRDFYLYIDEFQNFTTSSFASILSEARKYRLSLTIAHQYLKQLDEATSDAVFGNVGSIVAFQVGADDAEPLAEQLSKHHGQLTSQDLTNLPKFIAYARLLIDGMPSNPFSMQSLSPPTITEDRLAIVSERSRREHAVRRAIPPC